MNETAAVVKMLWALGEVPTDRRLSVLADVCKVVIERPDWIEVLKIQRENRKQKAEQRGTGPTTEYEQAVADADHDARCEQAK